MKPESPSTKADSPGARSDAEPDRVVSCLVALSTPVLLYALHNHAQAWQPSTLPAWVPMALALGLMLAGTAALVTALMAVVQTLRCHPYAALSAPLSVLIGLVMVGLNAQVHVGPLDANALAFACLSLTVIAGAVTMQGSGLHALLGLLLCALPTEGVFLFVWSQHDFPPDAAAMFASLSAQDQTYLAVLTFSTVLLSTLAMGARNLTPHGARSAEARSTRARTDKA